MKPLGESKSEWEIFGLLCEAVARRAKERGVEIGARLQGRALRSHERLRTTPRRRVRPPRPEGPRQADRQHPAQQPERRRHRRRRGAEARRGSDHRAGAPVADLPDEQRLRSGRHLLAAPLVRRRTRWPGRRSPAGSSSTSTIPGTSRRARALPVHKDPPGPSASFPLRINGGHTRWSIHAIWRDHELMLRLQRGEPACFMSPADCAPRGIEDGDTVRVFNARAPSRRWRRSQHGVQPGEVIIYHAWEPYQFKNWQGQDEPVEAPWKAIHLAGGYGQIHYRMFYGSPSHAPRGAPVEVAVERVVSGVQRESSREDLPCHVRGPSPMRWRDVSRKSDRREQLSRRRTFLAGSGAVLALGPDAAPGRARPPIRRPRPLVAIATSPTTTTGRDSTAEVDLGSDRQGHPLRQLRLPARLRVERLREGRRGLARGAGRRLPADQPDVPDFNPRGCQKGACYSDRMHDGSRLLHPMKRVGERGAGSGSASAGRRRCARSRTRRSTRWSKRGRARSSGTWAARSRTAATAWA